MNTWKQNNISRKNADPIAGFNFKGVPSAALRLFDGIPKRLTQRFRKKDEQEATEYGENTEY